MGMQTSICRIQGHRHMRDENKCLYDNDRDGHVGMALWKKHDTTALLSVGGNANVILLDLSRGQSPHSSPVDTACLQIDFFSMSVAAIGARASCFFS